MSGRNYELDGGARGWATQEGTQGTPQSAQSARKKKGDAHGLTSWDLKMAARAGKTIADLLRQREEAGRWVDAFQKRIRDSLVKQGLLKELRDGDVPF